MQDQLNIQNNMDLHEATRIIAREIFYLQRGITNGQLDGKYVHEKLAALEWVLPQLRAAERRLKEQQEAG
jgi:hypothetical protein